MSAPTFNLTSEKIDFLPDKQRYKHTLVQLCYRYKFVFVYLKLKFIIRSRSVRYLTLKGKDYLIEYVINLILILLDIFNNLSANSIDFGLSL